MTSRELLRMPESLLGKLDRQRVYLLRVEGTPVPCPACQTPVNVFDAAGIDLDAYDFGATPYAFRCPACAARVSGPLGWPVALVNRLRRVKPRCQVEAPGFLRSEARPGQKMNAFAPTV